MINYFLGWVGLQLFWVGEISTFLGGWPVNEVSIFLHGWVQLFWKGWGLHVPRRGQPFQSSSRNFKRRLRRWLQMLLPMNNWPLQLRLLINSKAPNLIQRILVKWRPSSYWAIIHSRVPETTNNFLSEAALSGKLDDDKFFHNVKVQCKDVCHAVRRPDIFRIPMNSLLTTLFFYNRCDWNPQWLYSLLQAGTTAIFCRSLSEGSVPCLKTF